MSLVYTNGIIRSILGGLGFNAYDMAKFASTFNHNTLEVEVGFNKNLPKIDFLEMEREFGMGNDSNDADVPDVQQRVTYDRNGGCKDS